MQRHSTKLRDGAPQPEQQQLTLLAMRQPSRPVSLGHIPNLKSTRQALEYACQLASLEAKEIYLDMEVNKTIWSRICSGEFDLDGRDIPRFNKVVGNSAYLLYLNYVDGWDLVSMRKQQDDKDRRIAELEQKVADQDRAMRLWADYARPGRGV